MSDWLQLLRVKHWVKNAFILFPLLFSGRFFVFGFFESAVITFFSFSFLASSVYILNDFFDVKKDLHHPKKAQRFLAQGGINSFSVFALIIALQAAGFFLANHVNSGVVFCGIVYILINLFYNLYTKSVVILDVIFVAAGFHVRIWAGAVAIGVYPSIWLQMCVFLLALFLGFTKRRHEIAMLKDKAAEHRSVLAHYTAYLLDQMIIICSTLSIVFYGLYTISSDIVQRIGSNNMLYTLPFVIYGMFRYLYLVHVQKTGGDPSEILLADKPLLINVLSWIVFIIYLLYCPAVRPS
jgi:4-hydroxybenzoate polyprenyltransferase